MRDFIFVADVVPSFVAAMEKQESGASICNVCTGEGTTVLELAQLVSQLAGEPQRIRYAAARAGEVRVSIGYPRRLADYYGIVPSISLRDGRARCFKATGRRSAFSGAAGRPASRPAIMMR